MKTFKYPLPSKFFYRYASLFLSSILLVYFVLTVLGIKEQPYLVFSALLNLTVIYLTNRYYYKTYKSLPFIITVEADKLTATNFMLHKKVVEIKYSDIDNISGGVFGYNPKGIITIHDGEHNVSIAIHPSIIDVNKLLKIILDRINRELRDEMAVKLRRWEEND